jgi:hypothetical protein
MMECVFATTNMSTRIEEMIIGWGKDTIQRVQTNSRQRILFTFVCQNATMVQLTRKGHYSRARAAAISQRDALPATHRTDSIALTMHRIAIV